MDPTPAPTPVPPAAPASPAAAAATSGAPVPREPGLLTRGIYAQAVIWLTVLFVVVMTALIWYRWSSVSLPTSNIIPVGDESVEGAEATVTGNGDTIGTVRLEKKTGYAGTIWLLPGLYLVTVKLNDRVVERAEVAVKPMRSVTVRVSLKPRAGAATAPTTAPATSPATRPAGRAAAPSGAPGGADPVTPKPT